MIRVLVFTFLILTGSQSLAQQYPQSVSCTAAQLSSAHAFTGHRDFLDIGTYGFCIPDSCVSGFELANSKCLPPATVSWFSQTQSITEAEYDLILRAKITRALTEEKTVNLSTVGSTAIAGSGGDFEAPSTISFAPGTTISDAIIIKIHRRAGYQPVRVIQLIIGESGAQIEVTINDSEKAPNFQYLAQDSSVIGGETATLEISFSETLSNLFPTKIKVNCGDLSISGVVPARQTQTTVQCPTDSSQAGSVLTISVDGMPGTPRSLTVTCPTDQELIPGQGCHASRAILTIIQPAQGTISVESSVPEVNPDGRYDIGSIVKLIYTPPLDSNASIDWSSPCTTENDGKCSVLVSEDFTVTGNLFSPTLGFDPVFNASNGYFRIRDSESEAGCFSTESCSGFPVQAGATKSFLIDASLDTAITGSLALSSGSSCSGSPCQVSLPFGASNYSTELKILAPTSTQSFNSFLDPLVGSPFTFSLPPAAGQIKRLIKTDSAIYAFGMPSVDQHFNSDGSYNLQYSFITKMSLDGTPLNYVSDSYCKIGENGYVSSLVDLQIGEDGKYTIFGNFRFNDTFSPCGTRSHALRLNSDGTYDPSFQKLLLLNGTATATVYRVLKRANGNIVYAGDFNGYKIDPNASTTIPAYGLLEVTADNVIVTAFSLSSGARVYDAALLSDDSIVVVGDFTTYNGSVANGIARIQSDGSLSPKTPTQIPTYRQRVGVNPADDSYYISSSVIPDQSINTYIIGGTKVYVVKYNEDGTINQNFKLSNYSHVPYGINSLKVIDNNLYLLGYKNTSGVTGIVFKVDAITGQPDTSFTSLTQGSDTLDRAYDLIKLDSTNLLIAGRFFQFRGVPFMGIAPITKSGLIGAGIKPSNIYKGIRKDGFPSVTAVIQNPSNGNIMISGDFSYLDTRQFNDLAELNLDGSLTPFYSSPLTFRGTTGIGGIGFTSSEGNQQIVAYSKSGFNSFGSTTIPSVLGANVIRLNIDGSLDGVIGKISGDALSVTLSDGMAILGLSKSGNGATQPLIAFDVHGGTSTTPGAVLPWGSTVFFRTTSETNSWVTSILKLTSGKYLVGGQFAEIFINGNLTSLGSSIVRLNSDGTLDTSFNSGINFNQVSRYTGPIKNHKMTIYSMLELPSGKVLIGGDFSAINNNFECRGLALVGVNGGVTCNPSLIPYGALFREKATMLDQAGYTQDVVSMLYKDSQSRIYVGGQMTPSGSLKGLVRLNYQSGDILSIDNSFISNPIMPPQNSTSLGMSEIDGHLYFWGLFSKWGPYQIPFFVRTDMNGIPN